MRDPERMKTFLSEIEKLWKRVPDWRFAQLMCNFIREYGDPFYLEEEQFLKALKNYMVYLNEGEDFE